MSASQMQAELGELLDEIVELDGWQPLVTAPTIAFDEDCFPDAWSPTLEGVRTALRRFLRHVRLPDVPVVVHDGREGESNGVEGLTYPVLFDGIEDGAAHFVVSAIGEPAHMAGWMCLEAVQAWAEYHGHTREQRLRYREAEPDEEEDEEGAERLDPAAAVTIAVHLGLGPVIAAGNVVSSKREDIMGARVTTAWSRTMVSGLPPQAITYLLALRAVVRDGPGDQSYIRQTLDSDQRKDFDRDLEELGPNVESLRERLGIPDPSQWPLPGGVDITPLSEDDDSHAEVQEEEFRDRVRHFNAGHRVFRVLRRATVPGLVLGAVAGLLGVGFIMGGVGTGVVVASVVAGAFGAFVGHNRIRFQCSDPDCESPLLRSDANCPRCGGTVSGQIASARERLEAEEALEGNSLDE